MAGTIKGITIEINGDATKLSNALKDVNKECTNLNKSLKNVDSALKLDPTNTELLAEKQQVLADAVQAAKEKVEALESVQDQVTAKYEAGEIDRGAYLDFQKELAKSKSKLEQLEEQQKEFGSVAKQVMQEAGEEIQKYGEKIQSVGDGISSIGEGLTKKVTTPIVAVGTASVAAFSSVDEGYDTIIKATGAAGEAAEELNEIYRTVSTEMPVEMADVATAIGEINTRFKTTGKTLEEQTKLFLEFAKVTDGDVQSAVANAAKIMEAWNLDMSALPDLLGMVTAKGQETGISVDTLMQSVQNNGAAFKELGFTLEESINFMAQMEANGVESSTALAGLKKATNELTDAGMDESDALAAVIDKIKNAATETEALEIAQETFGTKGAAEMATAIREGRIDFDDLSDSMDNYATTVQDTYDNTVDGVDSLTTTGNAAKIALSEVGSVLSDMMAPVLETVTEYLKNAADKFASLDENTQQTIITIALIAAAIGPVIAIVGGLVSAIGTVISIGGTIVSGIGALLSGPIVLIVAAIAAVIAIIVLLWNNCEWFRDGVAKVIDAVVAAFQWLWDGIKSVFAYIVESLQPLIDAISEAFQEGWELIQVVWDLVSPYFETIWENIKLVFSVVETYLGGMFSTAWTAIKAVWDIVVGYFTAIWESIKGTFSVVKSVLTGDWQGAWDGIKGIVSTWGNFFQGVWDSITSIFSSVGSWFSDTFSAAWDAIKGIFSNWGSFFSDLVASIFDVFDTVLEIMSRPFASARDFIKEQIEKIKSFFDFSWSLPALKLPHVSITGEFSLSPLSVPKFSISWYKAGGILDGATIFGALGNNLLGGGEAGQEAVLPLDSFYNKLESILGSRRISGISVYVNIDRFDNYGEQDIDQLSETVADKIYWAVQRKEAALT